jgi:hypothetical protein
MGGQYSVPPTGQIGVSDFGPTKRFRVEVHHAGGTVVISEAGDAAFAVPGLIQPLPGTVDVVSHGVPGRLATTARGETEIPMQVVKQLLENAGISPGTRLRFIICHGGESPLGGVSAAERFAKAWNGEVSAANGFLKVEAMGRLRIHLGDWNPDPIHGGQTFTITGVDQGTFVTFVP